MGCRDSGYEVLRGPGGKFPHHCRAFKLDSDGDDKVIRLARSLGRRGGCTTCTGTEIVKGFRATITGTVDSSDLPRRLKNVVVMPEAVGCTGNETVIPDDQCTLGPSDKGIVLAHGSFMVIGWGVLL